MSSLSTNQQTTGSNSPHYPKHLIPHLPSFPECLSCCRPSAPSPMLPSDFWCSFLPFCHPSFHPSPHPSNLSLCCCSGQAAALAGGTTMHIDFALPIQHDLWAGYQEWRVGLGQDERHFYLAPFSFLMEHVLPGGVLY
jgi:hypothetical protein